MRLVFALLVLSACGLLADMAGAQDRQWQAFTYTDASGQLMARVDFGVPRSDEVLVSAICTDATPQQIELRLHLDPGPYQAGDQVLFDIRSGYQTETRPATLVSQGGWGVYADARLDLDDSIWELLMAGYTGRAALHGASWSDFHLTGSHAAISRFLASCDGFAR